MTPHSQDMRGLRFRSTFSGAPRISFRQHRLGGVGPEVGRGGGQQELGIWGEQAVAGQMLLTGPLGPGRPSQVLLCRVPRLFSLCSYSEKFRVF